MDWDKLRIFHAVATAGSLSRAGGHLHTTPSTLSRQITALEKSLGVALFQRQAHGMALTEQGEMLYSDVGRLTSILRESENRLRESRLQPSGYLRVNTTFAFGSTWLTDRIGEFMRLYPQVRLSLLLSDHALSLTKGEADIAIRMHAPAIAAMEIKQRVLGRFAHRLYSSVTYINQRGMPKDAADLANHDLLAFGDEPPQPSPHVNWMLALGTTGKPHQPLLTINSINGIFRAVRRGLGIASLPEFMHAGDKTELVHVLPKIEGPMTPIYMLVPEHAIHIKRIALFRDFLVSKAHEGGLQ